ncbi:hypothetical protein [Streptomyces sp. ICBB 8177]|uniref:hypothetical protein n=1 Tax=Streptomyces sp. ICBB 8177 TaxID=563922 RepID=UPI000D67DF13|nr:hypothetical protein [Streptomyces sp. ICBB 8177]PWI45906.1 hypothetical protein CK485_01780 [Streptomyces sp. ICBB 8177]
MSGLRLSTPHRDPARWVGLPTEWPLPGFEREFPDAATWAATAARAIWDDSPLTPRPAEVAGLTDVLTYAAHHFPGAFPGFEVLLHLPGPRDDPLPVYLGDLTTDPEDVEDRAHEILRHLTGADDPYAVEPPVVEEFGNPFLGQGLRVLRYTADDRAGGALLPCLRYAWHLRGIDGQPARCACLFALHPDPARLIAALDDLDTLARDLRYEAATGTGDDLSGPAAPPPPGRTRTPAGSAVPPRRGASD